MLDKVSQNDFLQYLNSNFSINNDSGESINVKLVEVSGLSKDNTVSDNSRNRAPFSILFSGPMQPTFPQGIYKVEHSAMNPIELFIVPVGPDDIGMRYEAVFN